jgi:NAD(P)H-dependent FMN reductase
MKILAISGSLSAHSSNSALLRAAATLAPEGLEFAFYDEQLGDLPPFNPDLDAEGAVPPPTVEQFRALLRAADGVLLACPEYAHGPPGTLKNALDWIVSSSELEGKPLALIVASPGGGQAARAALTPTLEVMGARLVASVSLTFTRKYIDEEGRVADPDIAQTLKTTLEALASEIAPADPA